MSEFDINEWEAEGALADAYVDKLLAKREHQTRRNSIWTTKKGTKIAIKEMEDSHLFHAYNKIKDERLFEEMVYRLFETRIKKQGTE